MYTWVIYDIHKNKTRNRVAKQCKYYGLQRVQKSVFLGKIKRRWIKLLHVELSNTLNHRTDRLFVVPMTEENFGRILQAGAPPVLRNMVRDEKIHFPGLES